MSTRDMHGEVMRTLEGMRTKMDGIEALAKEKKEQLRRIGPQRSVPPVPRPKQGTQLARGASVTKYLRQYTREKNQGKSEVEPQYKEFSDEIDDRQYNTDALNALEWILALHLGSDLGVLTWEQVCKQRPEKMGLIIRDAINAAELKVFSQAAGHWAIQMLITNKMNSRLRYNRERRALDAEENGEGHLAPMTVPDLPGEIDVHEGDDNSNEVPFDGVAQDAEIDEPEWYENPQATQRYDTEIELAGGVTRSMYRRSQTQRSTLTDYVSPQQVPQRENQGFTSGGQYLSASYSARGVSCRRKC